MSKPKTVALYLRVSTGEQTVENQRRDLEAAIERRDWRVVAEFCDEEVSGANGRDKQPGFDRLHRAITRRQFDIVAAWSVDRLGRSLQDLVGFLGELHGAGVDLYLDRQGVDTSTPAGKALFQMLGVFAEFERSIIQERNRRGHRQGAGEGHQERQGVRAPKLSAEREAAVRAALAVGTGIRRTARLVGTGNATMARIAAEMREVNHFRFDPLKRWIKLWERLTPHGEILAVLNSFVTA